MNIVDAPARKCSLLADKQNQLPTRTRIFQLVMVLLMRREHCIDINALMVAILFYRIFLRGNVYAKY